MNSRKFLAHLLLVLFGLLIGGGAAGVAAWALLRPKAGTTFDNLSDLRRTMLQGTDDKAGDDSVTLRTIIAPHPDDQIIYDLRPNLDVRFQRANVRTNSCGMRSPERPAAKAPGVFRVALLGDSFTFGWGVEQRATFAQRMEDTLNRALGGSVRVEVLNFGVPGYSTFQETAKFLESGVEFDPDAVVVFFVENDFGMPFFIRTAESSGSLLSSLAVKKHSSDSEARRHPLPSPDPNTALQQLADSCSDRGIPLFVAFNPKRRWVKDRKKLWVIDQRSDIRVMNLREEFMRSVEVRGIPLEALTLSFDPHPSELKHALLGDLMALHLLEVIH